MENGVSTLSSKPEMGSRKTIQTDGKLMGQTQKQKKKKQAKGGHRKTDPQHST
jgi:hypothetical protein